MEGVVFLFVVGAASLAVLVKRRSVPAAGGSRGGQVVHSILKGALPASEYTILRDLALHIEGGTTHIDHIVVSRYGIFVIVTEDLAGSIFGSERDSHWIRSLQHYRSEFPNPLWQNRAYIRALQKLLGLHAGKFHSLVVFTGRVEFCTDMPLNVMQRDRLVAFFQVRTTPTLTAEEVAQAVRTIESRCAEPEEASRGLSVPRSLRGAPPACGAAHTRVSSAR